MGRKPIYKKEEELPSKYITTPYLIFTIIFFLSAYSKPFWGALSYLNFLVFFVFQTYSYRDHKDLGNRFLPELIFMAVGFLVLVQLGLKNEYLQLDQGYNYLLNYIFRDWLLYTLNLKKIFGIISVILYFIATCYLAAGTLPEVAIKRWHNNVYNILNSLKIRKATKIDLPLYYVIMLLLFSATFLVPIFIILGSILVFWNALNNINYSQWQYKAEIILFIVISFLGILAWLNLTFVSIFVSSFYIVKNMKDRTIRGAIAVRGIVIFVIASIITIILIILS